MDLTKSFGEEIQKTMATTLCKAFPYLRQEALDAIAQQCKHTIFGEQMRELVARRLREEFPYLKQDALEEIAQQCKQTVTERITTETPDMQASHARVNLLTLPPEVRNRISMLALTIDEKAAGEIGPDETPLIEIVDFHDRSDSCSCKFCDYSGNEEWMEQPPLTRVCKQLRDETLPIYYANTFLLHVWDYGCTPNKTTGEITLYSHGVLDWLTAIGAKNRDLIRKVVLQNATNNWTGISPERFAAALNAAGVSLNNCVITSYWRTVDRRTNRVKGWRENRAADDNISSETVIKWQLSRSPRFNT